MKPKTLILLGVALVCGLGASYATSQLLAERQVAEPEMTKVLVVRKNLAIGDPIKVAEEMFEEKEIQISMKPPDVLDSMEGLKGRVMKVARRAGDYVHNEDMFGEKDSEGLFNQLANGYRAVGVRVSLEDIANGFASLPLSRVDIISTVRTSDDKSSYVQYVLEDVLVVAADTSTTRSPDGKAMPASIVTLSLKPEPDLAMVKAAQTKGPLSLVLRKLNDTTRVAQKKMFFDQLLNGPKEEEPEPPEPTVKAKEPEVVAKVEAPKAIEPQGTRHILSIREGDAPPRNTEFLLNDNKEVITPLEVTRTELPPTVQAPPSAPPAPPAAPPPSKGSGGPPTTGSPGN